MKTTLKLTSLALILAGAPLLAQDGGLYEDVLDPNASFVRVITLPMENALVQTTSFDALETGVSPYVVIAEPGEVKVTAGTAEGVANIGPGTWMTYVIAADGTGTFLTDEIKASPAQADVAFYNLSDMPSVELYVPAAKAAAIAPVATGESGSVALKAPLTLDFEAKDGETVLATVSGVELKRRDGVTFVFRGSNGTYELLAVPNSIAR
jgi:hypothetical protein